MRWEFQHWEDNAVGESSSTFPLIALYIGHPGERYTDIPVFRKASLASVALPHLPKINDGEKDAIPVSPQAVRGRMPHRYSMRSDKRYLAMTVECARCKTKQKIHIANGTECVQTGTEGIPCIKCDYRFEVKVPDKFIRGPFPA